MNISLLFKIAIASYFLAVNIYGFILVNFQRKYKNEKLNAEVILSEHQKNKELLTEEKQNDNGNSNISATSVTPKNNNKKITNLKLFIIGLVGGAIGIYSAMLIYKHKLSNFFLMVIMPVFIAVNLYLLISGIIGGFTIPIINNA